MKGQDGVAARQQSCGVDDDYRGGFRVSVDDGGNAIDRCNTDDGGITRDEDIHDDDRGGSVRGNNGGD